VRSVSKKRLGVGFILIRKSCGKNISEKYSILELKQSYI
jgi:hypothetical protein